jgi:hypothetical protein
MSNTTIYICDRCKESGPWDVNWLFLSELCGNFRQDLCRDCREKFFAFMKKKPYKD